MDVSFCYCFNSYSRFTIKRCSHFSSKKPGQSVEITRSWCTLRPSTGRRRTYLKVPVAWLHTRPSASYTVPSVKAMVAVRWMRRPLATSGPRAACMKLVFISMVTTPMSGVSLRAAVAMVTSSSGMVGPPRVTLRSDEGAARGLHEAGLHLDGDHAHVGRVAARCSGHGHVEQRHGGTAVRHAERIQVLGPGLVAQLGMAALHEFEREAQVVDEGDLDPEAIVFCHRISPRSPRSRRHPRPCTDR